MPFFIRKVHTAARFCDGINRCRQRALLWPPVTCSSCWQVKCCCSTDWKKQERLLSTSIVTPSRVLMTMPPLIHGIATETRSHETFVSLSPYSHTKHWSGRKCKTKYLCFTIPTWLTVRAATPLATCRIAPHVSIKGRAFLKPLLLDPHPRVTWDKPPSEGIRSNTPLWTWQE